MNSLRTTEKKSLNQKKTNMIPYHLIAEFILNGVKWSYESYDYHKAKKDLIENDQHYYDSMWFTAIDHFAIPDRYKQKYKVWRIGKIRSVFFNPDGDMWRFKIGCRYAKNFYLSDFGVKVKPILSEEEDSHGLIQQGLAVKK